MWSHFSIFIELIYIYRKLRERPISLCMRIAGLTHLEGVIFTLTSLCWNPKFTVYAENVSTLTQIDRSHDHKRHAACLFIRLFLFLIFVLLSGGIPPIFIIIISSWIFMSNTLFWWGESEILEAQYYCIWWMWITRLQTWYMSLV